MAETTTAPTPDAPAAPATPPAPEPSSNERLFNTLFDTLPEEAPKSEDGKEGEHSSLHQAISEPAKPAEEKPATPGEPAKPEPDKPADTPPVRVKKKKEKVEEPAPVPQPPPAPVPPKPEPEPEDEEADLVDEERDRLSLAKFAAKQFPEKYKDLDKRMLKFFKGHAEFIKNAMAKDPEVEFNAHNREYQAFLEKNQPKLTSSEIKTLERQQIKAEVSQDFSAKEEALRDEIRRVKDEPVIIQRITRTASEIANDVLPADIATVLKEKGFDEAKKQFPMEMSIADQVSASAAEGAAEFIKITNKLATYNPNNKVHAGLVEFINLQCDDFAKNGGEHRIRDGKRFVTKEQWHTMTPQQQAGAWTFTNDQIVGMIKQAAKVTVSGRIQHEYKIREAQGWKRQVPTSTNAQQPPTPPVAQPNQQVRTAPRPGAGVASSPDQSGAEKYIDLLGYNNVEE